ncbi:glycosyltransferase [Brevundimonas sp. DC300-4]|uniref:glycosyltransferase n=1 Tax=Brevundimonas sp. DC300-4 TaxID=2804594 RepID=UPI003CEFF5BB
MTTPPDFYFTRFEHRRPPQPLEHSLVIESLYQFFAVVSLTVGAWYISWRWLDSLNYDALWFSLPMVIGETCAYFGLILFTYNIWAVKDYPQLPPPATIGDCTPDDPRPQRPLAVDIFIATYNEDEELVRLSIKDARAAAYPHDIELKVFVLDDGRRARMAAVAREEGVGYITRGDNVGYKAGNIRNAMEQTSGDFIVICDADTRLFPQALTNTMGYFRDPDVAFVQTPQWFFDLPEGTPLPDSLRKRFGAPGAWVGRLAQRVFGEIRIGEDPFVNDPAAFYDIIQRRRNRVNAAFCCGAASLHRREAVMAVALRAYSEAVSQTSRTRHRLLEWLPFGRSSKRQTSLSLWKAAQDLELTPYKFHVSEDIYTSIELHQDQVRRWKSVLHPGIESKMLSPQDLLTWTIQRFKYAGGSLDIFFHDNPITGKGMSLGQRLMYLSTFWSYFGGLWNCLFVFAPVIYFTTGIAPIAGYTGDYFAHAIPFLVLNEVATIFGFWGLAGYRSKITYLASFHLSLQALWSVARGQKIKFHVTPKERQDGNFLHLVVPQVVVVMATILSFAFALFQLSRGADGYSVGGIIANGLWGLTNILAMSLLIRAAFWRPPASEENPA